MYVLLIKDRSPVYYVIICVVVFLRSNMQADLRPSTHWTFANLALCLKRLCTPVLYSWLLAHGDGLQVKDEDIVTLDHRLTSLFNGAMLLLAEFLLLNNDDAESSNKLRRAYSTTVGRLFIVMSIFLHQESPVLTSFLLCSFYVFCILLKVGWVTGKAIPVWKMLLNNYRSFFPLGLTWSDLGKPG